MAPDLSPEQVHNARWLFMMGACVTYNSITAALKDGDPFVIRLITQGIMEDINRYFESFNGLQKTNPSEH